MRIEEVTPSKRQPGKFIVTLDNGDTFRADTAHLADFSLYPGRELPDDEFALLRESLILASARARALRILGTRSMSRREITKRLAEKGESADIAEEVAEWLERLGFINDEEYAVQIVQHYKNRGYGPMRIKSELARRGIDRELAQSAMENNDGVDEEDDPVYNYIEAKLRGSVPDRAERRRVTDALFRRGFSWDDINTAMRRYLEEIGE